MSSEFMSRFKVGETPLSNTESAPALLTKCGQGGIFRIALDAEFSILYCNKEYCSLMGLGADNDWKRQGRRSMARLLSAELFGHVREIILNALSGGEKSIAFDFQTVDNRGKSLRICCWGCFVNSEKGEPEMVGFIPEPSGTSFSEVSCRLLEETCRIVLRQSNQYFFIYDFQNQREHPLSKAISLSDFSPFLINIPDSLTESALIAPEDLDKFTAFFEEIVSGKPVAEAAIRFKVADGVYRLFYAKSITIFDEYKAPQRAVVSLYRKTKGDIGDGEWFGSTQNASSGRLICFEANITQDTIERKEITENLCSEHLSTDVFSLFVQNIGDFHTYDEDKQSYLEFMDREYLLSLYADGICEGTFEFCLLTENGPKWARISVRMDGPPYTDDVKALVVFTDIDRRRRELEQLTQIATLDSLTKTLNRTSIEKQISDALQRADKTENFALFMIDLDNFKQVNDKLGHQQGDKTLIRTASAIRGVFRSSDLVGRLGGDEFMVFMSIKANSSMVRKKAMAVINALQITVGGVESVSLSASVGVAIVNNGNADFNMLYGLADKALYTAKREGKNRFRIVWTDTSTPPDDAPVPLSSTIQLQTLLRYMDGSVVLIELGEEIRLLYASPGYSNILDKNSAEAPDGEHNIHSMIVPTDAKLLEDTMLESAQNLIPADIAFRIQTRSGEIKWLQAKAVPIPYEDSEYPVMIVVITDITKLKEQEAALRESSERTRIAFDQTSQTLWEVDIHAKTFAIFDLEKQSYDEKFIFTGIPESMLEAGIAHPSSKAAFTQFFNEMLSGKPEDTAAFIMQYLRTGIYGWTKMSYHTLFDDDGLPLKAIGISEEMPTIFNEQTRFKQEEILFDSLDGGEMELLIVNLTTDTIKSGSAKIDPADMRLGRYSKIAKLYRNAAFSEEDALEFNRFMPKELIEAYAGGTTWAEAEYRHRDSHGNIRWVSCIANLIVEPVTRELYVFLIRRDIDSRRHWELSLPSRVERDNVSHLYSRATAEAMVASLIREKNRSDATCFLALVDINGLSQISESMGQDIAEQVRFSIGRLFRILLNHECIVGQLSEAQLLLFWLEGSSESQIKSKLEAVVMTVQKVREASNMLERINFTVGIASALCRQTDYKSLYTYAAYVCDKHRGSRQDIVVTFKDFTEDNRRLAEMGDVQDFTTASAEEGLRPLTPDEKETLLSCLMKILHASNYDTAMTNLWETLGEHYDADRVYQLALSDDGSTLSAIYEWAARGKHSLLKQLVGLPVDKFPIMKAALEKKQLILLRGPSAWASGNKPTQNTEWRFICGPIVEAEHVTGFLCVENPKKHDADTALISALLPLVLLERRRRGSGFQGHYMEDTDSLTGLLDRDSYLNELNSLKIDALSSLGVLYMDINGLGYMNWERGHEYGNSLLIFASRMLTRIFAQAKVFRISGHSFVILYQNVTYSAFVDRCVQAQSVLDKQYPKRFTLGYTWADKDFTVRKLVEHAQSIMNYNKQSYYRTAEDSGIRDEAKSLMDLKEAISQRRYTVYIQPKTRLSTGEVVGGEALARYLDPLRGIVSPAEFISKMEEDHVIRELDFFMLDQMLRIMQEWKERGKILLPISVNFSRQTLLDRSALAAVLAIHSRYDIPAEYVEIEITETLGMMERRTISHAVERFREQGFRISLDDFGSEYSNITMLSDIPFDSVKLDKSIINNFVTNRVSRSIVESMVKICEDMGALCIAEGVETAEQVAALKEAHCDYAQGYYYNKPLPANEFEEKYINSVFNE